MIKTDKPKGKYAVIIKFVAILLGSGILGGCVGFAMNMFAANVGIIGDMVDAFITSIIVPVQWTVFLSLTVASILLYFRGLRYVKKAEGSSEDELSPTKANQVIGLGITLCTANMILTYWLFGLQVTLSKNGPWLLGGVAIIILIIIYYSIYMAKAVALIKRINPEKRGDPLDLKFQKDWESSCDEGEKMVIYQAAFFSYKLIGKVILLLWVVTVIFSMFFGLGGYPITVITIIWFTHTIGYQWKCAKLEKEKLN